MQRHGLESQTTPGTSVFDQMVEQLLPSIEMDGGKKGVIVEVTMRVVAIK